MADIKLKKYVKFLTTHYIKCITNVHHAPKKGQNMAKVMAKVMGGDIEQVEFSTLGEVKDYFDCNEYQAEVNGKVVEDNNYALKDYETIELTAKVKGA